MTQSRQICTFHLGDYCYGVEVEQVQEVITQQILTHIPLAPPAVVGLMNIRGKIITAISARRAMRMEQDEDITECAILIMRRADTEVGLLADRIGDIIQVDEKQIEYDPDITGGRHTVFIRAVVPQPDSLVLLVDLDRLLEDDICMKARLH